MQNELYNKALNRCYFFLKFRPRTEKEVRNFLYKNVKKYKLNKKSIEQILYELKQKKYIDDKKFIDWFVLKSIERKPKATFLIKKELKIFGINEKEINEYFENNTLDEHSTASKLLNKYWIRWTTLDQTERRNKALNTLLRKGFSFDVIKKTIEEIEKK